MSKIVYLMRGLPSCGKSHRAKRLAGEHGLVLETDQYFYSEVGTDKTKYDYSADLLPNARRWLMDRFQAALSDGTSPIVIDRGNGLNRESYEFARAAVDAGYSVDLAEPDSPWWCELRVLLKYKQHVASELFDQWAEELSRLSHETHRVPAATIRSWMSKWRHDLTVDDILGFDSAE